MKERAIDRERAIVTHHQASKIPEPGKKKDRKGTTVEVSKD